MMDASAAAALSRRIAALLGGGGHPSPHHGSQQPPPPPSLDLTIDGQAVLLHIPTDPDDDPRAGAVPQLLAPLCLWLRGLVAACPPGQRVLVGVVGAAGAGKSYLCALLAAVLCRLADCAEEEEEEGEGWRAVMLSMDAYHLPNAELEARGIKHLKGRLVGQSVYTRVLACALLDLNCIPIPSPPIRSQATRRRWTRPRCYGT